MRIIPSKSQWKKWSLPSKAGYFGAWLTFLGILIALFTLLLNKGSNTERSNWLEIAKTQINNLINDYASSPEKIAKQFNKEINQIISSELGTEGSKIEKLRELPNVYSEKIDLEYRDFTRAVEDIRLKNFKQKDIKDIPELKTEAQKIDDLYNRLQKYKESFERRVQETKLYQDFITNKK